MKYGPHIQILPEDDADRQLANGFVNELDVFLPRKAIKVLKPSGGWGKVKAEFEEVHAKEMRKYRDRFLILLVDFDGKHDRRSKMKENFPADLLDRVFVIGARSNPEELKSVLKLNYEDIGKLLAENCRDSSSATWHHELLAHNAEELGRMTETLRPILFPSG